MVTNKYDYQIFVFLSLVLVFELWERLRPARHGDRYGQLKLDALSFVFAIIANRICTGVIARYTGGHVGLISTIPAYLEKLPLAVRIGLAILVVDFIIYWLHRAQHRFAILWRTHAWHHSPEHLYWLSGFRTSLLHSFINNIPQVVVPIAIFHLTPFETAIGYSLGLCIQFWEHTNLKVNIGALEWIFITPDYHRVHHSATHKVGKNLGTTFTFWDRMFGTFVDPHTFPEQFPLGLGEEIKPRNIPRMMVGV